MAAEAMYTVCPMGKLDARDRSDDESFSLSKLGRFNLLPLCCHCLPCHKLRTKLMIKIGLIYRSKSAGSLANQFIKYNNITRM